MPPCSKRQLSISIPFVKNDFDPFSSIRTPPDEDAALVRGRLYDHDDLFRIFDPIDQIHKLVAVGLVNGFHSLLKFGGIGDLGDSVLSPSLMALMDLSTYVFQAAI